jgi:nucleotide-binding universal stress UspA family protein
MPKPILAGFDPKTLDRAPVELGVAAARITGAPLLVLAVEARAPARAGDEALAPDAQEALARLEEEIGHDDVAVEWRRLRSSSAARALHEAAEMEDAGLLVVGSSKAGTAGRVLSGSTAQRLLHGAPCPIAVAPQGWTRGGALDTIGVAYVDSEEGEEALRGGCALARRAGATLRVITVVAPELSMYLETEAYVPPRPGKDLEHVQGEHRVHAEEELRRMVAALAAEVDVEVDALVGDPAENLVQISAGLDLLVCGSRGYGPLRAVLLGSVSRRVVAEARCPVVVLPRGVRASLEALAAEVATPA